MYVNVIVNGGFIVELFLNFQLFERSHNGAFVVTGEKAMVLTY